MEKVVLDKDYWYGIAEAYESALGGKYVGWFVAEEVGYAFWFLFEELDFLY